jgi:hypothetical protein
MAKFDTLHLVTNRKRNKDLLENLQLEECQLLEENSMNIVTLMLMDCNIRHAMPFSPATSYKF